MTKIIPKFLKIREKLPSRDKISAVYLLAFAGNKIISIKRGNEWDIPRERLKRGEGFKKVFNQCVLAENGIRCDAVQPHIILSSEETGEVSVVFIANSVGKYEETQKTAGKWEWIGIEKLLSRYDGTDKELLWIMIQRAREKLGLAYW